MKIRAFAVWSPMILVPLLAACGGGAGGGAGDDGETHPTVSEPGAQPLSSHQGIRVVVPLPVPTPVGPTVTVAVGITLAHAPATYAPEQCTPTSFDGRALGIDLGADVALAGVQAGATVLVADTGELPATGGAQSVQIVDTSVGSLLSTGVLTSRAATNALGTSSTTSVTGLAIALAGVEISADVLTTTANADCNPSGATVAGGADIAGLRIGGLPINVTGDENQTIDVGPVHVVIHEVLRALSGTAHGEIHVNALHVSVSGLADIVVSAASAGVTCECATIPTPPQECSANEPCPESSYCVAGTCEEHLP